MSDQELLKDIVRQIEELKTEQRRLASLKPLYNVWNMDTIGTPLAADANNYAVGDYDLIFIAPTANRIINGLTGGVKGRFLIVKNQSTFTLTFTNQNASATAENRILTPTLGNIVLASRQSALFIYVNDATIVTGTTRWLLLFPAA